MGNRSGKKASSAGLSPSSSKSKFEGLMHNAKNVPVENDYDIKEELGKGTFSIVKRGVHKKTKESFAVKFISKEFVNKDNLILLSREIAIMKKVNHPNVLNLIEIFETQNCISIVTELVEGGELFYQIVERGSYSEKDASKIIFQIISGVKYLHELGVAHRDLKPENLLCGFNPKGEMIIKIADFGLSKIFAGGQSLRTSCGTPIYAAPEVFIGKGAYDCSVDLWSIGVITYVVLCGYLPFFSPKQTELFEKIINAEYNFPDPEWSFISDTAKDFIRGLLMKDAKQRMTTEECLRHPFLAGEAGTQKLRTDRLKQYNEERKKMLEFNHQSSSDFFGDPSENP